MSANDAGALARIGRLPEREPEPPTAVRPPQTSLTMFADSVDRSVNEYSGRVDVNTR